MDFPMDVLKFRVALHVAPPRGGGATQRATADSCCTAVAETNPLKTINFNELQEIVADGCTTVAHATRE
jgi:hypothetical protein